MVRLGEWWLDMKPHTAAQTASAYDVVHDYSAFVESDRV